MLDNEAFYDADIVPALRAIQKKCAEREMSFLAVAEYNPGEWGRTTVQTPTQSLALTIMHIAAQTGQNVDSLIINIRRHCHAQGIDMRSSMVLAPYAARQPQEGESNG